MANHDTDHPTVLLNDGRGRFAARELRVHSNPHPHMIAAAEVNRDHHTDLITDSWAENPLTLLRADGRGGWQTPGTPIEIGREPIGILSPLISTATGHFTRAPQSPIVAGPVPFTIAIADVNGNSLPDIVVVKRRQPSFDSVCPTRRSKPLHGATGHRDVNGDGIADAAVPNSAGNDVTIELWIVLSR